MYLWVEGTLKLEYGKSGIYNNNRLPAEKEEKEEKKEENTRDRSVPDGSDKNTLKDKKIIPIILNIPISRLVGEGLAESKETTSGSPSNLLCHD